MAVATMTSKGQITVPVDVREALHLEAGTRVDFRLDEASGTVTLVPLTRTVDEVFGMLKGRTNGKRLSLRDMDEAIARAVRERHGEST